MKKVKALLSLALVGSMLLPSSTAFAAEVTTPGGSADSQVTLTVGDTVPKIFSVTVPSEIPINITKGGEIQVAKNLNIRNDSSDAVEVTAITVTGKNDWSVVDYSDDFVSKPDNSKVLALSFRGDATDSSGNIIPTPENWAIAASQELDIRAEAKLSRQTNSSSKSNIATVNWSFNWADATTEPEPPDTSSINHNWDPSTIMVIGSAKDVVFDWSSTMDVNNISTVESSNPDVATIELSPVQMFSEGTGTYTVTGKAVGKTTIRATLTSGESTSFEVTVNDVRPGTGGDGSDIEITIPGDGLNPGDKIDPDIEIEIPVITPDGDGTITVKPEVPDTELTPGDNEIPVEVDINGIKITVIIKVTVSGGTSNPSDGLHQSIEEAQAVGFAFSSYEDGLQIDSFENKQFKKEINVPEQIGDFKVLRIGDNVFKNQSNLTEITLPSTVTAIGTGAFSGCTNATIEVPSPSFAAVDAGTFTGVRELRVATLTPGKNINGVIDAIAKGTNVYVDGSLFTDTDSLAEVRTSGSDSSAKSWVLCVGDDGSYIDPTTLDFAFGGSLSKPAVQSTTVNAIIPKYVNGTLITSLPGDIVYYQWSKKAALRTLYVPDSVTEVTGAYAWSFSSYPNKGTIVVTINNNRGAVSGIYKASAAAYIYNDTRAVDGVIVFPEGTTEIPDCIFMYRTDITSVFIPSSVTTIGDWAFSDCTGITNIDIPSTVTSIGNSAFNGVKHVTYSGTASGSPWGAVAIN